MQEATKAGSEGSFARGRGGTAEAGIGEERSRDRESRRGVSLAENGPVSQQAAEATARGSAVDGERTRFSGREYIDQDVGTRRPRQMTSEHWKTSENDEIIYSFPFVRSRARATIPKFTGKQEGFVS